jgi:hypothetical protein
MSALIEVTGTLISTVVNHYDFTSDDGRKMVGDTLAAWLDQGPEAAPGEVRFKSRELFDSVRKVGPGTDWSFRCELSANNNRAKMTAITATPAPKASLVAVNGVK